MSCSDCRRREGCRTRTRAPGTASWADDGRHRTHPPRHDTSAHAGGSTRTGTRTRRVTRACMTCSSSSRGAHGVAHGRCWHTRRPSLTISTPACLYCGDAALHVGEAIEWERIMGVHDALEVLAQSRKLGCMARAEPRGALPLEQEDATSIHLLPLRGLAVSVRSRTFSKGVRQGYVGQDHSRRAAHGGQYERSISE